jgi:uncharacterized 2Fe-2S/4Fe-4S cluster protein (DUF4445 family)
MESVWVDFEPIGRRIEVPRGTDLLSAAQQAGVQLVSICGGIGSCEECIVRLDSGEASPPTLIEEDALSAKELGAGLRLACQTHALTDVKVDVPPESLTTPQRLQIEGQSLPVDLQPLVIPLEVRVAPPTLHDLRADTSRIADALAKAGLDEPVFPLSVLRELSTQMRDLDWHARLAMRGSELLGAFPLGMPLLGLAVDIGTTKMAAYLVDLITGQTLAKAGEMNPQVAYGEDVVSRIDYTARHPDGRATLQARVVQTIGHMADSLCAEAGFSSGQIVDAVFVGNTAMHHLCAGLPVHQLGVSPYVPAVGRALDVPAHEIGLQFAAGTRVHLPPNIAGYVGADHVSMLLATEVWQTERTVMAIDIGTNTEITLASGGRMLTCSCASGPAFEGAHIRDGMRAAPGAIERIQINNGQVLLQTINNEPAVGICGSGILDAVAQMLCAGALNSSGKMLEGHPHVRGNQQGGEFLLVPPDRSGHGREIVISRKDVNEIQLAKAAIRTGMEILLLEAGISHDQLDEVIVAGAFGTYLDVGSAKRIGMFPPIPDERYRQVGNAAGEGAKQMLLSSQRRTIAQELIQRIEYIELTIHNQFTNVYMKALYL